MAPRDVGDRADARNSPARDQFVTVRSLTQRVSAGSHPGPGATTAFAGSIFSLAGGCKHALTGEAVIILPSTGLLRFAALFSAHEFDGTFERLFQLGLFRERQWAGLSIGPVLTT